MKERISSIECFRVAFTCCIAVWHLGAIEKLNHGYLPVEFFFILSGIWLYVAYEKGVAMGQTALQYTWIRIKRIYPSYLISFLAVLTVSLEKLTSLGKWLNTIPEVLLMQNIGPFPGGLNYPLWYLSVLIFSSYLVYTMLELWGSTAVRFLFPLISLGTYTYIFSQSDSIEHWSVEGPFYLPLARGVAGLCLGVCLRVLADWARERETSLGRLIINISSLVSVCGVVLAILWRDNLDRYCLLFFSGILLAGLTEDSWLNKILRGSIWQRMGKYTLEMFMIHVAVIAIWKRIPWEPFGMAEKSLYTLGYLVAVFVAAVAVNKLGGMLHKAFGKTMEMRSGMENF